MNKEKLILVTNDDGIDSPGILALVNALRGLGRIVVVAPDRQQSAVGHALTVMQPLRATPFHRNGEDFGYAVNGTPSDCVKLAVHALLDKRPDIVVSGINHGQNTSVNVLYSGTVSAASEGMLLGIPSIAISLANYRPDADCSVAGKWAARYVGMLIKNPLPNDFLLNINVPALPDDEIKGSRITRQSNSIWADGYEKRTDPFGRDYYWFTGEYKSCDADPNTDDGALLEGYISVTPIYFNFTKEDAMQVLENWQRNCM